MTDQNDCEYQVQVEKGECKLNNNPLRSYVWLFLVF